MARERRDAAKKLLADGIDPSRHKKAVEAAKLEEENRIFENIALEWHKTQTGHIGSKEELQASNAVAVAEIKARQKAHKQRAYANLAKYGPEFVGIARILLPKQHSREMAKARKELPKTPKLACGRFKDWLRQRSPWLADIWRLRRILTPGMKYGQFADGQFPKVGKLQNPLIAYLEMVRRRHAEFNKSRLEAATALHLRCAGYLRKNVEEEMQRHTPPLPIKTAFRQISAICNAFWTTHLERKATSG